MSREIKTKERYLKGKELEGKYKVINGVPNGIKSLEKDVFQTMENIKKGMIPEDLDDSVRFADQITETYAKKGVKSSREALQKILSKLQKRKKNQERKRKIQKEMKKEMEKSEKRGRKIAEGIKKGIQKIRKALEKLISLMMSGGFVTVLILVVVLLVFSFVYVCGAFLFPTKSTSQSLTQTLMEGREELFKNAEEEAKKYVCDYLLFEEEYANDEDLLIDFYEKNGIPQSLELTDSEKCLLKEFYVNYHCISYETKYYNNESYLLVTIRRKCE